MQNFKKALIKYIWNVLFGIDQLANAILGGDPDETISSRMGKKLRSDSKCPFCRFICKLLNLFEKDHCIGAIEEDEGKDAIFK